MKRVITLVALFAFACTGMAFADKSTPNDTGVPSQPLGGCDLTGYKNDVQLFDPALALPDNTPSGIVLGPINLPDDGSTIDDVIIDLDMDHTWLGDLIVDVSYSLGGTVRLMCREPDDCPDLGFGCSADLVAGSPLLFSDDGAVFANPCASPTFGCFAPSAQVGDVLSAFDGLPKGGDWTLSISDNAAGDLGFIAGWSVHLLNGGETAAEATSWGSVKGLYR